MSDAAIFVFVFGGLLVLRIIAATVVFVLILPRGDQCPLCNAATIRLHAPFFARICLAKRWCLACGWDGAMRISEPSAIKAAKSPENAASRPTLEQPSRKH